MPRRTVWGRRVEDQVAGKPGNDLTGRPHADQPGLAREHALEREAVRRGARR